jgi:hypothetical protein
MTASALRANFYLTCRSARFGPSTEIREHVSALHPVASIQALIRRRRKLADKLLPTCPEHCKSIIRIRRMYFGRIEHPCACPA